MGKIYSIINKVKVVIGKVLAPVRAKYGKFFSRNREGTLKIFGFTLKDKWAPLVGPCTHTSVTDNPL